MQIHIAIRGGQILYRGEALTIFGTLDNLLDQLHRDHLTRLVVLGIDLQHLRLEGPMLVDLRGQLDKVALDTRGTVVTYVAHEAVQGVAKLMEERLHVVNALQGWAIGRRSGHVAAVHHDRNHTLVRLITLATEARAPSTGTLRLAGEVVAVEDRQQRAVAVDHLVGLGRRLVGGHLGGDLLEGQPVEFPGYMEDALHHVADLQIGAQLLLIDSIFGLLGLVRVVHVVPAFGLERVALLADLGTDVVKLLLGLLDGRAPHLVEQVVDRLRRFGHTLLEHQLGVVRVTHQLGLLQAQLDNLGRDSLVVIGIVAVATVVVGLIDLLAQFAVRAVLQHRIAARTLHVEHPLSGLTLLLGHLGCGSNVCLGQTGQTLDLIDYDKGVVRLVEQVLREVELQHRELLVQLAQLGLLGLVELGTAAHETLVAILEHLLLLGRQRQLAAHLIDRLDTGKESLVEVDVVAVGRLQGRKLLLQRAGLVGRVAAREGAEGAAYTAQKCAALVEGYDRVFKGRSLLVGDDGCDLGLLLLHAEQHALAVVFNGDLVERSDPVRGGKFAQQRILTASVATAAGKECHRGGQN